MWRRSFLWIVTSRKWGEEKKLGAPVQHVLLPLLLLLDPRIDLACFKFEYLGSKCFVFYHI